MPILSSLATLVYLTSVQKSLGFSDIAASLIGFNLFLAIKALNQDTRKKIDLQNNKVQIAIAVYFLITIASLFIDAYIVMAIMAVLALVFITIKYKINLPKAKHYSNQHTHKAFLIGMAAIAVITFPAMTQFQIINNSMANGVAHFVGFYIGFFLPVTIQSIKNALQKAKKKD
ncbi:MAG: hypothetical protein AABW59_00070 [archaeon]